MCFLSFSGLLASQFLTECTKTTYKHTWNYWERNFKKPQLREKMSVCWQRLKTVPLDDRRYTCIVGYKQSTAGKDERQRDTDANPICVIGLWRELLWLCFSRACCYKCVPCLPQFREDVNDGPLQKWIAPSPGHSCTGKRCWDEECSMYETHFFSGSKY